MMIAASLLQLAIEETGAQMITDSISVGVGLFALLLLSISLTAYRRTRVKWMLFVSAGFALFAAKTLVQRIDLILPNADIPSVELSLTIMDLVILLLFFMALVKR
jgi:hypothetical protein